MAFTAIGTKVWPVPPDWANGVRETLAWGNDVSRSSATLASHTRSYRIAPRRGFSFQVLTGGQEHRVVDMLLAGHRGPWLLPIFHDVSWLSGTVGAGSVEIACAAEGRDFVAGGKALLYGSLNRWEVVDIASVAADHLALSDETMDTYGPGSRLYPLRRAILQDGAQASLRNDRVSNRSLAFDVIEPCDWPALGAGPGYLSHPVLDARPDESDDSTSAYEGARQTLDFGAAPPSITDLPGIALRNQRDSWKLHGRPQHTWFRSLLYARRGSQRPVWVPSWASDLHPVAPIAGGGSTLTVEWAGYTLFGLGKPNRRDIRIELVDGTVYLRRVTASAESGDSEVLTLSASLDAGSIAPGRIRQISIMALCRLAGDDAEINHVTDADGLATATTGWQATLPDV